MTECASNNSYTTATGVLKTTKQVKVDNIKLPCLSKTRRFTGVFEVIPEGTNSTPYGVFLGSTKMRELDIDTSLRNNTITWGEDIAIPMVQRGYWTSDRINARLRSLAQRRSQVKEVTEEVTSEAQPQPQAQVQVANDVNTVNGASQVSSKTKESLELNLIDALQQTNPQVKQELLLATTSSTRSRCTTRITSSFTTITILLVAFVLGIILGQVSSTQGFSVSNKPIIQTRPQAISSLSIPVDIQAVEATIQTN